MAKRVVIVQSNYIPWKGYFHMIASVDEFILYDDVKYTTRDWRNRNKIKTRDGTQWLTVPVREGAHRGLIRDVVVADPNWAARHWRTIRQHYAKAAYLEEFAGILELFYRESAAETHLSAINEKFILAICTHLGIRTRISRSSEFELEAGRSERLVGICQQAGAKNYLTGPAAKTYLDVEAFANAGMTVSWMDYSDYPEYRQLHGPSFIHEVSIIDLLLNEGIEGAKAYMASLPAV